jgi:hypothetical protein
MVDEHMQVTNLFLNNFVGFEVLTVVVMKNSIFLDTMSCSPLKVNQCFGETCCVCLQGQRIRQARNSVKAGGK